MAQAIPGAKQLTVNAAFLKEIKDDNLQLKALWDKVIPLVQHRDIAANHWTELVPLIAELRDQLALHFSLEEAFGYFDEAIDIAPRLSLAAESLRRQHGVLYSAIRDLADQMETVDGESIDQCGAWLDQFTEFRRSFESHEESELRIILESLDDDLGVAD